MATLHPLGGKTSSTFEAEKALLDFELSKRKTDIHRLLGQQGPGGWVPGEVELGAARNLADLERQRRLTVEEVTNAMRQGGTLFSGIRAREQARAEHPLIQSIARTREDTARTLNQLYQELSDIAREREVRLGLLLAQEAKDRAARLRAMAGF
jgi:hypothetical protein